MSLQGFTFPCPSSTDLINNLRERNRSMTIAVDEMLETLNRGGRMTKFEVDAKTTVRSQAMQNWDDSVQAFMVAAATVVPDESEIDVCDLIAGNHAGHNL
jgi:hypothetical protein